MKKKDICRLCGNLSELRESHIIPKSIFKLVRDKKLNYEFYELHNKKDKKIKDGPKEYLLCDKCEQYLGNNYEKYFKEAIHLNKHGVDKVHDEKKLLIKGFDYKKIKLFLLSLLWRASVSSKPEFENICLGENEEMMREMILNDSPGKSSMFSMAAIVPLINNRNSEALTSTFFVWQKQSTTIYCILIGGILYLLSSAHQNTFFPEENILRESGCWIIPLEKFEKIPFLKDFIDEHFDRPGGRGDLD